MTTCCQPEPDYPVVIWRKRRYHLIEPGCATRMTNCPNDNPHTVRRIGADYFLTECAPGAELTTEAT